jgi:hypothetical protein
MPTYTYSSRPHDLSLLHDQLLAAGLTPALVEGREDEVRLTFTTTPPGGEAAVAAVVTAHDPAGRPPDPAQALLARLDDAGALTQAEVRQTLRFLARRVLRGLRE